MPASFEKSGDQNAQLHRYLSDCAQAAREDLQWYSFAEAIERWRDSPLMRTVWDAFEKRVPGEGAIVAAGSMWWYWQHAHFELYRLRDEQKTAPKRNNTGGRALDAKRFERVEKAAHVLLSELQCTRLEDRCVLRYLPAEYGAAVLLKIKGNFCEPANESNALAWAKDSSSDGMLPGADLKDVLEAMVLEMKGERIKAEKGFHILPRPQDEQAAPKAFAKLFLKEYHDQEPDQELFRAIATTTRVGFEIPDESVISAETVRDFFRGIKDLRG
ncbi:MAG: hypothetical protein P4L83_05465 [Nevskia sp.]|nr:hypothetical protein [Nevskia sp.]